MNDPKPRSLQYASALAEAEDAIVQALPDLVKGLIDRAREGDTRVAVYLIDRVLGRPAGSRFAPADDQTLPYTEDDFREARLDRKEHVEERARLRKLFR